MSVAFGKPVLLSEQSRRACLRLTWIIAVLAALHTASVFLSDPVAALYRSHADLGGVGLHIAIPAPVIRSGWIIEAVAVAGYLFPLVAYAAMAHFCFILSKGAPFTVQTLSAIRRLAGSFLAISVQQIVFNSIVSLMDIPRQGASEFVIMVSTSQFLLLLFSAVMMILSGLVAQAVEVADEIESIL